MDRRAIDIDGAMYWVEDGLREVHDNLYAENLVLLYDARGTLIGRASECASTEQICRWILERRDHAQSVNER
ncbi:MAG: hypothetical protein JO261_11500 [Alphaproteobacteria bacterium]|nr:hypothetical protein [Alphaproteobacteria bacterium]